MRVIVFFDLPSVSSKEKRIYRGFRKFLVKNGFIMMQESVYTKLALNQTVAFNIMNSIKSNRPEEGIVQMLCVTEKQFSKMEYVVGMKQLSVIDSDERFIEL